MLLGRGLLGAEGERGVENANVAFGGEGGVAFGGEDEGGGDGSDYGEGGEGVVS